MQMTMTVAALIISGVLGGAPIAVDALPSGWDRFDGTWRTVTTVEPGTTTDLRSAPCAHDGKDANGVAVFSVDGLEFNGGGCQSEAAPTANGPGQAYVFEKICRSGSSRWREMSILWRLGEDMMMILSDVTPEDPRPKSNRSVTYNHCPNL